jgi:hypothetical protein
MIASVWGVRADSFQPENVAIDLHELNAYGIRHLPGLLQFPSGEHR